MRRFSCSVVGLATMYALVGFSGCTQEVSCDSGWCGTVVIASTPAQNLFPPLQDLEVEMAAADLIFSKLADVGPSSNTIGDTDFVPNLATSWNFDDDLTISVSLNPLARWHDGAPVTAQDVVFSFGVYQNPVVNSSARSRLGTIASAIASDSMTVVFKFNQSYPEQFYDAVSHVHILPSHILESVAPEDLRSHEFALHPVGSGPYKVVRWIPGESLDLAADSTHHLGRPGVPRIIWSGVDQPPDAVNELLADRADYTHIVYGQSDLERIKEATHLRLAEYPSNTYNFVGFNLRDPEDDSRPHPLFGNRDLRRAMVMAVNRPALVQSVLGANAIRSVGPVTPALSIWDANLPETIPFDSAAARIAFAGLGWSDSDGDGTLDRDGRPLEFDFLVPPSAVRARGAVILQDQLARSGIRMNIVEVDWPAYMERIGDGTFDAQFGSIGQDPSPSALAINWTEDGFGDFNVGKYSNPEYTRLARAARAEANPDQSLAKWHAALRIINEDAPAIWLWVPKTFAAMHVRFEDAVVFPHQPFRGLPDWRVPPANLIQRDLFGAN